MARSSKHTDIRDMTHGSLWKGILTFSLPLIFSNLLQILFNMSDIAVVGRFSGPWALGAVGSTTTLDTMFVTFLIGVGAGINVTTATAMGRRDEHDIHRSVHTAFLLSIFIGLGILVLGQLTLTPILSILKTKPELIDGAALYMRIAYLGMPALCIFNFGNAVFSAAGDTKKPLLFLSMSGILNVLFNLFFVIVLHMDVAGVALATIIAQYISATCILIALIRAHGPHALRMRYMRIDHGKARTLLCITIPAGFQNAIFQIANLFVQYGVNTFSATIVAGTTAAQNADGLVYDTMAAFYTASGSYIGQNYGAGKRDRIKKTYLITLFYSFSIGLLLGVTLAVFGRQFLSIFTTDPAVIAAGRYRLTIMGISYGFSALMDNSIAASRGLGKANVPTVIVILGSCVFRVIWIFTIFRIFRSITSLYLLYIFSWTLTGIAEAFYFRKLYKEC